MIFKRNMFGQMNWLCFLLGHRFCLYGSDKRAICMRCELDNPKFTRETGRFS